MSEDNWPIYFYQTSSKKEPIKEFLDSLPAKDLAKARKRMKLLKEFGPFELGIPYIKQIEDKLWELRISGDSEYRILWFIFAGDSIVLLHGFVKKTDSIPRRHIETAYKRMELFLEKWG